mmetsp:Transcript_144477/g.462962  ORF Transcript_144477/g.462962 Transcript_144477/m.462962 type:complete len:538 (+) Transcript_144477:74-1687(+)
MGGQVCKCSRGTRGDNGDALLPGSVGGDMVAKYFGIQSTCRDDAQVCLQMRLAFGSTKGMDANRVIPLVARPSPFVKGMQVYLPEDATAPAPDGEATPTLGITKKGSQCQLADSHPDLPSLMNYPAEALRGKPVIIGTVRMGFGHHRIAYSAVTWALEMGAQPYLIDILAVDSPEAVRVAQMDAAYSKMSRLSSNIGGIVDEIWTRMLLQGGVNSLRLSCLLAEQLKPLMADLPKDWPVIAAHPWIGQIAVACGFETVINLVIDNYPQYFVLVPGALNLVQSPSYFSKLLNMGIPPSHLKYAGHWVSRDIAKFAAADCSARLARIEKKLCVRILIAIGGAGAQQVYVQRFILGIKPFLLSGRVKLFINSGDHGFMAKNLTTVFQKENIDYVLHRTQDELNSFIVQHQLDLLADPATDPMISIFNFDTHYAAFRATDLLIRVADVLATKPSELAFFPIPKLHLRHVGGHESFSAERSCELGDGTTECTTVELALQHVQLMAVESSPMLLQMNKCIIENDRAHIYDGSKVAVETAIGVA